MLGRIEVQCRGTAFATNKKPWFEAKIHQNMTTCEAMNAQKPSTSKESNLAYFSIDTVKPAIVQS